MTLLQRFVDLSKSLDLTEKLQHDLYYVTKSFNPKEYLFFLACNEYRSNMAVICDIIETLHDTNRTLQTRLYQNEATHKSLLQRHNELKTQRIQLESQNKALRIERIQLESQNKALSKKLQAIQYEKELFTKERKHLDKQKQS
eukprot:116035_1